LRMMQRPHSKRGGVQTTEERRKRQTEKERQRQRQRETERERQRERDRERQRQRETERGRERQREVRAQAKEAGVRGNGPFSNTCLASLSIVMDSERLGRNIDQGIVKRVTVARDSCISVPRS
jgi:hypothetical protein